MTSNPTQPQPDAPEAKLFSIETERFCREKLIAQRGQLLHLRSDLLESVPDDSVRRDAAKLPHLEAAAQLEGVEARMDSVMRALDRLDDGSYGHCADCQERIPADRLEARPDARLCVSCCEKGRSK